MEDNIRMGWCTGLDSILWNDKNARISFIFFEFGAQGGKPGSSEYDRRRFCHSASKKALIFSTFAILVQQSSPK